MGIIGKERKIPSIALPMIAEFFGMMIFNFTHCSTVNTMIDTAANTSKNPLLPATNDGLTVTALVWGLGHISGGHFNFAVTVAVTIGGGLEYWKAPLYLVAQLLGSVAGASLAALTAADATGFFTVPGESSILRAFVMELMITLFLTLTVLMTAVELKASYAALAIGITIWIGILAGFGVSGGCMNPTISFGPAVVSGKWEASYWVYWVGPIAGACVAGLVFRTLLSKENNVFSEYLFIDGKDDEGDVEMSALKNDEEE